MCRANFAFVLALWAYYAAHSVQVAAQFCSGTEYVELDSGETHSITDHTGGGYYMPYMDCSWQIGALSDDQVLRIEFSYFDSAPQTDTLTVCDTGESTDTNVMAIISGNQTGLLLPYGLPTVFYSSGSSLRLHWSTTTASGRGFALTAMAVSRVTEFSCLPPSSSALIGVGPTDAGPVISASSSSGQFERCTVWLVGQQPPGGGDPIHTMALTVQSASFPGPPSTCSGGSYTVTGLSNTNPALNAKFYGKFCPSSPPDTLRSSTRAVKVDFVCQPTSSCSLTMKTAYNDANDNNGNPPQLTILLISAGICIAIFACVVICTSIRRRASARSRLRRQNAEPLLPGGAAGSDFAPAPVDSSRYGATQEDLDVLKQLAMKKQASGTTWMMRLNSRGTHVLWARKKGRQQQSQQRHRQAAEAKRRDSDASEQKPSAAGAGADAGAEAGAGAGGGATGEARDGRGDSELSTSSDKGFLSQLLQDGSLAWVSTSSAGLRGAHERGPSGLPFRLLAEAGGMKFTDKQRWFRSQLQRFKVPYEQGHVTVSVRRANVLEDSFTAIMSLTPFDMRRVFRFTFIGEPGLDAGGLTREWFHTTAQALLNAETGLFLTTPGSTLTYTVNPFSGVANEAHLQYFLFAGRFIGKALLDAQVIPTALCLPLLKQVQGVPVTLSDLQFLDPSLFKSLKWIKENSGVDALGLDFTVTKDVFGEKKVIPLKPGGEDIDLTDENKSEYLHLRLRHEVLDAIAPQLSFFLRGVYEVIPQDLLSVFDPFELELLLCGLPAIDVGDWRRHTRMSGLLAPPPGSSGVEHRVVGWFWEVIASLSHADRARLLQFATGTSRVPAEGFKGLTSYDGRPCRFTLNGVSPPATDRGRLVVAHSCFNRLDVPLYSSKDQLSQAITIVLRNEDALTFGEE